MKIRIPLNLAFALLLGCAGDEATPPTDDDVGDGDTDEGTDEATDDGTDEATDDGTDEATDTGDECVGPDGCFACPPTNPIELGNACTDATCEPFANTPERLPLLERDGTLPPLP